MIFPSCSCAKCASACRRIPGIFHPIEALRAIRAGLADDIMEVGVENYDRKSGQPRITWSVLMPRSHAMPFVEPAPLRNYRREPFYAAGRCVFLDADERCEIHDRGFKPIECRAALACKRVEAIPQYDSAKAAWRSFVGVTVVKIWTTELKRKNR